MSKLLIPDGMMDAADQAWPQHVHYNRIWLRKILEAALQWQAEKLYEKFVYPAKLPWQSGYNTCLNDIRDLYTAPETESAEEHDARIRREARKRCLDEFAAFSKDMQIEHGIGADVIRVYALTNLREEQKSRK
jgi:hypothetical protein